MSTYLVVLEDGQLDLLMLVLLLLGGGVVLLLSLLSATAESEHQVKGRLWKRMAIVSNLKKGIEDS